MKIVVSLVDQIEGQRLETNKRPHPVGGLPQYQGRVRKPIQTGRKISQIGGKFQGVHGHGLFPRQIGDLLFKKGYPLAIGHPVLRLPRKA